MTNDKLLSRVNLFQAQFEDGEITYNEYKAEKALALIQSFREEVQREMEPTAEIYERFINKYLFIRGMYWGSHGHKDSAIISASGGDGTEEFFKNEVECFLENNPEYDGRDFYILLMLKWDGDYYELADFHIKLQEDILDQLKQGAKQ